jgi:thioredoxin
MELREPEFEELVLNSDRPVLVDFWASWCPPCKMMQPVVDRLAAKLADWADVYSVNIDRNPALAARYEISGVPTFVAFARGKSLDRRTGALTEGQLTGLLMHAQEAMESGADRPEPKDVSDQPEERTESAQQPAISAIPPASSARPFITIVSGLPRSGTSLMMRMLNVGGIPALCDEQRTPDADNPNGYYEFEDVKSIENYGRWIDRAPGHAVKMVYSLLRHLPADREYRVIFMRRHLDEILQSQRAMLQRKRIETDVSDDQLKQLFERALRQFYAWLPSQGHLKLMNVSYNELLSRPDSTLSHINRHLDDQLQTEAMIRLIDPGLYRNRAA